MAKNSNIKVKLSLDTSEFSKGLARAKRESKSFGNSLGYAVGKAPQAALYALGAAATALTLALAKGIPNAYQLGSRLNDMSDKTGIAAGQMRILQQAAKDNGIEDIVPAIGKMQAGLVTATKTGTGPAAEALAMMGMRAEDLVKKSPVDELEAIAAGMQKISNPALQAAIAKGIFGKSGTDMLPLFKDPKAMSKAKQTVGGLAPLYDKEAGNMDETARKMDALLVKEEQFMAGLAVGMEGLIDRMLDKLAGKDATKAGEGFGKMWMDGLESTYGSGLNGFGKSLYEAVIGTQLDVLAAVARKVNGIVGGGDIAMKMSPFARHGKTVDQALAEQTQRRERADAARATQVHKTSSAEMTGGRLSTGSLSGASNANASLFYDRFHGGLEKQHLMNGGFTGQIGALNRGAYGLTGSKSQLSHREKQALMDARVAAGEERPGGAVHRGDKRRRDAFLHGEALKEASLADVVAPLLRIDRGINGTSGGAK